jgi:Uma2 family endonuclease
MITRQDVAETTTNGPPAETLDWSFGWRYELVRTKTGATKHIRVPLTPEEARHPEEGYITPERTEHDFYSDDLCDMLRAHYADKTDVAVFRNLIFRWDRPDVGNYAPDVAVVAPVRDRDKNRSLFVVADEGVRPLLVIEVVSRNTRRWDRVDKVRDYALVGVQEYVYLDVWERRGQTQYELAGFRLEDGRYLPILPDEDGAIFLQTVNLRIGLENGRVWLEDAETGQDLLTNVQAQNALRAAKAHIAALEAELATQRQPNNANTD